MLEYKISKTEMESWCKIPVSQLESHPDRRAEILLKDTRGEIAELLGK